MIEKVPYWLSSQGRDNTHPFDLDKTHDSNASDTLLSELLGPPAGYIDPLYSKLVHDRNREFIVKVEVDGVEYGIDELIDFSIENSLSLSEELELGTVIPNKLTIRFWTHDQFRPNAKIVPYIALKTDTLAWDTADLSWDEADFAWEGGTTDWIPLGEFFIDNRSKDRDIWTYVCYDRLVFADVEYVSGLNYPAPMKDVWDEICDLIGFEYDDTVVIDPTYTIPAAPTGYTCRQVMGFIASANSACVFMGRDGVLRFKKISANAQPLFEMTASDYVRAKQVNPLKTYSRVVIIYDDEGNFYEAGTGSEAETMYIENPFGTQEMAGKILSEINGFSYLPISMPARGYPHLQQGDVINVVYDKDNIYRTIILHQVLDFRGGLSMQIEAPSISEQQSEFGIDGSLTAAVKRLNQNAVKFGKPYYGVTHSRTEGIVVQREDGTAKAVFNADELSFYANGDRALWFDIPNKRFKFAGTLEGVDGTFSGTVQAGTIQGGTINAATINGGSISGATISGGTITGGAIFGGTITASTIIGSIITGGTIQSASAGIYPRFVLDASTREITFHADATQFVRMGAYFGDTAPYLMFSNSYGATWFTKNDDYLVISGDVSFINELRVNYSNLVDIGTGNNFWYFYSFLQSLIGGKQDAFTGLNIHVPLGGGLTGIFVNGVLTQVY